LNILVKVEIIPLFWAVQLDISKNGDRPLALHAGLWGTLWGRWTKTYVLFVQIFVCWLRHSCDYQ